jgi:hypothetical protein
LTKPVFNHAEQSRGAEEVFRAAVQRALDHPPEGYETDLAACSLSGGDVSIVYRKK